MTDHMKELNEKFKPRKLLEELSYFANYPPMGYVRKAETDLLQWVLYNAYKVIKEGGGGEDG